MDNIPSNKLRRLTDEYRRLTQQIDEIEFERHRVRHEIQQIVRTGEKLYGVATYRVKQTRVRAYVSSQPIIQLKELEVDRIRYDAWKKSLTRPIKRKQKTN